jgi:hypothetical protein
MLRFDSTVLAMATTVVALFHMANVGATVATYMLLNRGLKRVMGVGKVRKAIRLVIVILITTILSMIYKYTIFLPVMGGIVMC